MNAIRVELLQERGRSCRKFLTCLQPSGELGLSSQLGRFSAYVGLALKLIWPRLRQVCPQHSSMQPAYAYNSSFEYTKTRRAGAL